MNGFATRLQQTWRPLPAHEGIDMGDGVVMDAVDVLEGHARRLQSRHAQTSAMNVGVQVDDDLVAAITVLAPNLASLTEVAEEIAQAVPPVHPAPQFRQHLHEALERTHQQYAAQRLLGTRPPPANTGPKRFLAVPLLIIGGVLAALVWWRFLRHNRTVQESP